MPTLWAQTTEFGSLSVGDSLPILVKFDFRPPAKDGVETPQENPVSVEKLTAYVKELLMKGFPPSVIDHQDTVVDAKIITPFLPGDTVSLSGAVVGKIEDDGRRLVECRVIVETEEGGATVARANVVISF